MNLTTPAVTIKAAHYAPDSANVAADLRSLADAVEDNPFLAALIAHMFGSSMFPLYAAAEEERNNLRELMAETIRQLQPLASGPVKKRYGDKWFYATVPMCAIELQLAEEREQVCTRVVTGVETVTEEIPDPEYIAAAPKITQTREVEVVEWKCEPLMKAAAE
jgi:hypothetical protein